MCKMMNSGIKVRNWKKCFSWSVYCVCNCHLDSIFYAPYWQHWLLLQFVIICDSTDCWWLAEERGNEAHLLFILPTELLVWFLLLRTEMMTVDGWGLLGLLTGNYDWSGLAIDTFRQTLQYQMWRMNYLDSSVPSVPLNLYLIELFNCAGYKI